MLVSRLGIALPATFLGGGPTRQPAAAPHSRIGYVGILVEWMDAVTAAWVEELSLLAIESFVDHCAAAVSVMVTTWKAAVKQSR